MFDPKLGDLLDDGVSKFVSLPPDSASNAIQKSARSKHGDGLRLQSKHRREQFAIFVGRSGRAASEQLVLALLHQERIHFEKEDVGQTRLEQFFCSSSLLVIGHVAELDQVRARQRERAVSLLQGGDEPLGKRGRCR